MSPRLPPTTAACALHVREWGAPHNMGARAHKSPRLEPREGRVCSLSVCRAPG